MQLSAYLLNSWTLESPHAQAHATVSSAKVATTSFLLGTLALAMPAVSTFADLPKSVLELRCPLSYACALIFRPVDATEADFITCCQRLPSNCPTQSQSTLHNLLAGMYRYFKLQSGDQCTQSVRYQKFSSSSLLRGLCVPYN